MYRTGYRMHFFTMTQETMRATGKLFPVEYELQWHAPIEILQGLIDLERIPAWPTRVSHLGN